MCLHKRLVRGVQVGHRCGGGGSGGGGPLGAAGRGHSRVAKGCWQAGAAGTQAGPIRRPLAEAASCVGDFRPGAISPAPSASAALPRSGRPRRKRRQRTHASAASWTLHDLKQTFVTQISERGFAEPHVVAVIINHMSGHKNGVAGVYNTSISRSGARRLNCGAPTSPGWCRNRQSPQTKANSSTLRQHNRGVPPVR
jgi:hypothetical protein